MLQKPASKIVIAGVDATDEWRYGPFTPFAQTDGVVPLDKELDELLKKASAVLGTLHGISDCHTAAKRFVAFTGLGTYRRGWYTDKLWEHSWVEFSTFVLDIYPVGGARPLVVAKVVANAIYHTTMPPYISKHPKQHKQMLDIDGDVSRA